MARRRRFFEDISTSLLREEGENLFSKLNPATKLIYVILSFIAAFLANTFPPLLILLTINLGLALITRSLIKKILSMLRGLSIFILTIFTFNVAITMFLGETDLIDVLLFQALTVVRVFTLIPPLLIFITTTTPLQIIHIFSKIGIRYTYLYPFMIAYRFIPLVFYEMKNIYDAQRSRGIELEKGGLTTRLKGLSSLIIPSVVCSTIRARDLAEALTLRGFGYSSRRSFYRSLKFSKTDILFIAIAASSHLLVILLPY